MGLFWGSKKEKVVPLPAQKPRELTENEKLEQRYRQPMGLGYVTGCGPANADPEFSYLIRRIDDAAYKNNCIVREIRDLVRGLIAENQELKQRVEKLEHNTNIR